MTVRKTEAGGKEDDTANDDTDELCVVLVGCVEKTAGGDTQIFQNDQLRGRFQLQGLLTMECNNIPNQTCKLQ